MPIRVNCPSCGRGGRVPDQAIGRNVQCPACQHRYRLTADMAVSSEDSGAIPKSSVDPLPIGSGTLPPAPPTPRAGGPAGGDHYSLEEPVAAPRPSPSRVVPPAVPGAAASSKKPEPTGESKPASKRVLQGVLGVALLVVLPVARIALRANRHAQQEPAVAAPNTPPAADSAPAVAPVVAPAVAVAAPPDSASPAAPAAAPAAVRNVSAAPGQISVAEVVQMFGDEGRPPALASAAAPSPAPTTVAAAPAPVVPTAPTPAPAPAMPATPAPAEPAKTAAEPTAVVVNTPAPATLVISSSPDDTPAEAPGEPADEAKARAEAAGLVAKADDGPGKAMSTAEIVAESEPSVALIKGNESSGTGFLVAPGLLATNAHVIDDELISDLEIRFVSAGDQQKGPFKAELLYEDAERDLAFLAVKTDLKPLRVAKTYTFRKGEDITVIGNPGMGEGQVLENAISRGVMSTKTQIENRNFYQLGVAINPGNSGGPVFDSSGRVIGVATLKSSKQESMGFSIPIEDMQLALTRVAKESSRDGDSYRSRHRLKASVKELAGGGALMFLVIDLRRLGALTKSAEIKELLAKLEPITAELNKEAFPSLMTQTARIKNDPLLNQTMRGKMNDFNENFKKIRAAYSPGGKKPDDNQLRAWKQTHKRLTTDLFGTLKLEIPAGLLTAFDDHGTSQMTIVSVSPQNLGSYGSRLRQRRLTGPGANRPSLRERMGRPGSNR